MANPIREDFQNALARLEEVLNLEKNDIYRDSAIKRFEICFDLAWKAIKDRAKHDGLECYSPRECFKTAFQLKLIEYDEQWLEMLDDRNRTTHLYNKEIAEEVYQNLHLYLKLFRSLDKKL